MGKVIQMADWKNRKANPDPVGCGKTYTYSPSQDPRAGMEIRTTTDEQEEALKSIKDLLKQSIDSDQGIYQRPTVQGREAAAVASLGFHMQAINIAKEHGITIRRMGPGVSVPKIFEVIVAGQILIVK